MDGQSRRLGLGCGETVPIEVLVWVHLEGMHAVVAAEVEPLSAKVHVQGLAPVDPHATHGVVGAAFEREPK